MKKPAGNPKIAIALVRVSTDKQEVSPEAQRASIAAWAKAAGVQVVAWHEEVAVSGKTDIEDREGLLAAMADVKLLGAGVLVVAKRDRLCRDSFIAMMLERMATNLGAVILSAAGEGNGDTLQDALMRRMVDAFAEYERGIIALRTRISMQHKKARGELVGSVPLGKRLEAGVLVRDDDEAAGIALAVTYHQTGMSLAAIGRELSAAGYNCRSGRPYQAVQVKRMLGLP